MMKDKNQIVVTSREDLEKAKGYLKEIYSQVDSGKDISLQTYNDLVISLGNSMSTASLFANVHPEESCRTECEKIELEGSAFATDLGLDKKLYQFFKKADLQKKDELETRLVKKELLEFKRSGVDRSDADREKIKQLNQKIVELGQIFDRNIRDDKRFIELHSVKEMEGLPEDFLEAHKPDENGKIKITTDYPDYMPFQSYAKDRSLRKKLAYEFKNRGYPSNEEVLANLLDTRNELALFLGYKNWADYVTETKMIKNGKAISEFIEKVSVLAKSKGQKDVARLLVEKKKEDPTAKEVEDWERAYIENKVKAADYDFDSKEVRRFFSLKSTQNGLLRFCEEMFDLTLKQTAVYPTWHESVDCFEVFDKKTENKIGIIYLDLSPRDGKFGHAAQFTLRSGVKDVQLPQGVLVCNFPQMMEHDDVVTFFHEFGHLIHHILGGNQKWVNFSGVATEWDFVEAPSQFLEEWAWNYEVLSKFAIDSQTGETISKEVVEKMKKSDRFGIGIQTLQQMFYASLSLKYHSGAITASKAYEILKEEQKRISPFPHQEGTHFHLNFGHLNGYSAMYYTYMWSKVIALDFFSAFNKEGEPDRSLMWRYRKFVLEPGGSKDANELVQDFLGREGSFHSFENFLKD